MASASAHPDTPSVYSIARVIPLLRVPQLDQDFDYSVPEDMRTDVKPGIRVQVMFHGKKVTAVVKQLRTSTTFEGTLSPILKLLGTQVVLQTKMLALIEQLADYYAGTRPDIIRSAVPTRVIAAEKAGLFFHGKTWEELSGSEESTEEEVNTATRVAIKNWADYLHSESYIAAILDKRQAAASWLYTPGEDRYSRLAEIASATAWSGQGVLIIAPHQRAVDHMIHALEQCVSPEQILEYSSDQADQTRYRRFLSIMKGQARIVVGKRSACFAPVQDLGLIITLDESDDGLVEPLAPYVHVRKVAWERHRSEHSSILFASATRSAELELLHEHSSLPSLVASRETIRSHMPLIEALGQTEFSRQKEAAVVSSRLPQAAFELIKRALEDGGTVLVSVPRAGNAPALACTRCRHSARCRHCNGPLEYPRGSSFYDPIPQCRWCGKSEPHYVCPECGSRKLRMTVVGEERTAEQLGKAFPGVPIVTSAGNHVKATLEVHRAIVVATPGSEPQLVDSEGLRQLYSGAVLLDPWTQINQEDLRSLEKAYRRWSEAACLVSAGHEGGRVLICAESGIRIVQHLIQWIPEQASSEELATRREANFPPAVNMVAVDGPEVSIAELENLWVLPETPELLGPVELPFGVPAPGGTPKNERINARRLLVRSHAQLGASLKQAIAKRAARNESTPLRVVVDPMRIG